MADGDSMLGYQRGPKGPPALALYETPVVTGTEKQSPAAKWYQ